MNYIKISSDFSSAHFLESEFMHGHNFKVKVKFCGNLNKDGMIIDFYEAKNAIDEICNKFDHKVIMPENFKGSSEIMVKKKKYKIPYEDIAFISIPSTTAEYVAEYIEKALKKKFKNLKISVELEENYDSSANFSD